MITMTSTEKFEKFEDWLKWLQKAKWKVVDRNAVLDCYQIALSRCPIQEEEAFNVVDVSIMNVFHTIACSDITGEIVSSGIKKRI
jgi:hypothetical protein